ncbi:MAG: hypothetical protein PF445_07280 [Melioribacteraceae bacterium]|jgi:hypothetical protein|nr:hypothetical protein [Melioribacteraceae bacterium]
MISKIKNIISEYLAVTKFARNQNSTKSFKKFFSEAKEVLVILPSNASNLSMDVIELIRFIVIHKKKLFLIQKSVLQNYLPTDYEYASLVVRDTDKTKFGLPTPEFSKKIKKYTFDLVIDLNTEADIFSSSVSNIPIADFRIGFVKNKSDLFYNYQIPHEINSEKSHRNLLNSLRMF